VLASARPARRKTIAVFVVVALGLGACGSSDRSVAAPTSTTSVTIPTQTIRLGFFGPLTGSDAQLGVSIEDGMELAASQYDVTKPGVKIVIERFDSRGNPATAASGATTLIDDKVVAVIGPALSSESVVADPVFEAAGIPNVTVSATAVNLARYGWEFFHRVVADDSALGAGATDFLVRSLGDKAVAVVDDSTTYGEALAGAARQQLAINGGQDVFDGHVRAGIAVTGPTVGAITAAHPTAVLFAGSYTAAGRLLDQLRVAGYKGHFMAVDGPGGSRLVTSAEGPGVADGTYLGCVCTDESASLKAQVFNTSYRAEFGTGPPPYSAEAYDATSAVLAAITSGASTPVDINTYLGTHSYVGITKTIKFLPNGNISGAASYVSEIRDGQIVPVGATS